MELGGGMAGSGEQKGMGKNEIESKQSDWRSKGRAWNMARGAVFGLSPNLFAIFSSLSPAAF